MQQEEEGVRGFHRGLSPALLASAGSWGGYFYFYENSKARKMKNLQDIRNNSLSRDNHLSQEKFGREELGPVDHVRTK